MSPTPTPTVHRSDRTVHEPDLTGDFPADRTAATEHAEAAAVAVEELPPRAERGPEQQRFAEARHEAARRTRRRFLALHAERVYADLTDGLTRAPRLPELLSLAAERYPGLVPAQRLMDAEGTRSQAHKEGWEIDQGLFLQAVLDAPTAGTHLLLSMLRPQPEALDALPAFRATGRADLGVATVTRDAGVAQLELNNAEYLNAEDDAAVEALEIGTDLVLLDDASHVGVVRGAPMTHRAYRGRRVFSAGINLTHLYHGRISFLGFMLRRELGYIAKFIRGLSQGEGAGEPQWSRTDKPWVAGVDGFAIGGGMQLLPALDRVVAADDAWFSLPAMEEGLVPGAANLRLPGLVGDRLTRRLIFWGRRLRADEPEAALLCDETVPADGMDVAVQRAAQHLDNPAVGANRRMLALVEEPLDLFRRYMARYAFEQSHRLHSPDLIATLERTWIDRSRGRGRENLS